MTPDEVVKVLETHYIVHDKEYNDALKLAISFLQDYQKLREKIDSRGFYDFVWDRCEADDNRAEAILTYLQQPTEH